MDEMEQRVSNILNFKSRPKAFVEDELDQNWEDESQLVSQFCG